MLNVQFSDATETVIIAYFSGPQNATAYPNQGTVLPSDVRWATYYATLPAAVQATLTPPTTPLVPTLAQVQATQSSAMQAACQAAIVAGFTSSALGTANNYPSDVKTQMNISLAVAHGGSLWCQPSAGGAWTFVAHTIAQATQVQTDLNTHIQAEQATYAGLLTQIAAATTVAAVEAVAWP
jgi:deferrochelatase/peroxidase EfeB